MSDWEEMAYRLRGELEEAERRNAELREALERCDKAIQEWWPPQTTVSPEGVAVIEAGRLANATLSKERK